MKYVPSLVYTSVEFTVSMLEIAINLHIYVFMSKIDWRNCKTYRADLWHIEYSWPGLSKFNFWEKIHTFDEIMT